MATTTSGISPVGSNNYQTSVTKNADGSLSSTTYRVDAKGGNPVEVYKVEGATATSPGTRTPGAGATAAEKAAFENPNSPERKAFTQQVNDARVKSELGITTDQDNKALANASGSSAASNSGKDPNTTGTDPQAGSTLSKKTAAALGEENKYKEGTRLSYSETMVYPLDLKLETQDVIKFSILKYSPSLAKENQSQGSGGQFGSTKSRVVTLKDGNPIIKGSERIGMITLPIPAGISDGNTVGWQNEQLNQLQQSAANVARGYLGEGLEGGASAIKNETEKVASGAESGDLQSAITTLFINNAVQGNIQGRTFGSAFNNNLELLFSGPGLRSFGFTFMFYPRSEAEAKVVKQIIRAFKQAMSVKRSATSLLLKAPHTFAIQYMTAGGVAHPYLNRFKECALTSCSVDYTPDGTYMTYGGKEKSMTSYRLTLQFQELEPLFDDEYGLTDDNIGF